MVKGELQFLAQLLLYRNRPEHYSRQGPNHNPQNNTTLQLLNLRQRQISTTRREQSTFSSWVMDSENKMLTLNLVSSHSAANLSPESWRIVHGTTSSTKNAKMKSRDSKIKTHFLPGKAFQSCQWTPQTGSNLNKDQTESNLHWKWAKLWPGQLFPHFLNSKFSNQSKPPFQQYAYCNITQHLNSCIWGKDTKILTHEHIHWKKIIFIN